MDRPKWANPDNYREQGKLTASGWFENFVRRHDLYMWAIDKKDRPEHAKDLDNRIGRIFEPSLAIDTTPTVWMAYTDEVASPKELYGAAGDGPWPLASSKKSTVMYFGVDMAKTEAEQIAAFKDTIKAARAHWQDAFGDPQTKTWDAIFAQWKVWQVLLVMDITIWSKVNDIKTPAGTLISWCGFGAVDNSFISNVVKRAINRIWDEQIFALVHFLAPTDLILATGR